MRYVKRTNNKELYFRWGFNPHYYGDIFIICDAEGYIDWDKNLVYPLVELLNKTGRTKLL
jgi:hypothetical protein